MRWLAIRIGLIFALLFFAVLASHRAHAQNSTVANMNPASTLTGNELFYCVQGGQDRKCTGSQIGALITTGQTGYFYANGSGSPTFSPTIPVGNLASIAANTLVGNFNVGPGTPSANTINGGASCLTALTYTNNVGFGCSSATASVFGSVANLAALRALTTVTFTNQVTMIFVNGANTVNDGGGGMYMFVSSAPADNGGTLIASNSSGGYYRQPSGSGNPISPQIFGAFCNGTGPGVVAGATDDTAAFTNMMAWANNNDGATIVITGNCYLASNVPLLHNSTVTWLGAGDFYRTNGAPFYPNPSNVTATYNTLFARQTGSDNNDGLANTNASAFATIQEFFTVAQYYRFQQGQWQLNLAAGSYPGFTMPANMCTGPLNDNNFWDGHFIINGPQPSGSLGRNVQPTAVIDGNLGPGGQTWGVGLNGYDCLYMGNIMIQNWSLEGIFALPFSDLETINVWLEADGSFGLSSRQSHIQWYGGTCNGSAGASNTQNCLSLINSTVFTIGATANAFGNTSPIIENASQVGVLVEEGATGHCDYCNIAGNQYGVEIADNSHIQVDFSQLTGNTGAMMNRGLSSTWLNLSNTITGNGNSNNSLTFTDTSP